MSDSSQQRVKSSGHGGDGVRVIVKKKTAGPWARSLPIVALVLVSGLAWLLFGKDSKEPMTAMVATEPAPAMMVQVLDESSAPAQIAPSAAVPSTPDDRPVTSETPSEPSETDTRTPEQSDDLASYFRPGDPEPTGAELIEALNEAGIHTGIGAFTPPGTSPPVSGLVVPDDFELPEGFVRHHQVTDDGEPLEPILMFSPDIDNYEAAGNVPIPEDRIVTPELAPPGMPIRELVIPKP